ncbi:MAG TPA: hypothetical protein VFM96_07415 [Gaiellaceae bacterium]|nr:hypothetical protein [Gaiellaceae bacterium]
MTVVVTLDADWAPAHVLDAVADRLAEHGIPATWFVTDENVAVDRLRARPDLFELGIHPNFLAGSTHGGTVEEVLAHCMELVPEARTVRTHALVQSTPILDALMTQTPIQRDVSVFLPYAPYAIGPVLYRSRAGSLLRLPYCWDDNFELVQDDPTWDLDATLARCPGALRIFNFHPIHVALNSSGFDAYEALKLDTPRLADATPAALAERLNLGHGVATLFDALLERLAHEGTAVKAVEVGYAGTVTRGRS